MGIIQKLRVQQEVVNKLKATATKEIPEGIASAIDDYNRIMNDFGLKLTTTATGLMYVGNAQALGYTTNTKGYEKINTMTELNKFGTYLTTNLRAYQ